jgi:hypothetical protein
MAYEKKTKTIPVGAIAIDSDALVWPLWKVPHAIKITAIRLGTNTTMTKADTNYNTFSIKNGSTTVATLANGPDSAAGTSIAAGAQGAFALVTTAGANEIAADSLLTLSSVKTGNGLAVVAASIEIDYYDYNA